MNDFEGKVAVITGGNSGIGLASAKRLRQQGARVAICGRDRSSLDSAAEELGVLAIEADVSRLPDIDRLYATVADTYGKLDILFANAGVFQSKPVAEVTESFFDGQFDINVKGLYFTVQKALPYLNDGASIILTSSMVHDAGWPGCSVYAAGKAAVRSLARSFSSELHGRGIRVNALVPGVTDTPILQWQDQTAAQRAEGLESLRAGIPLGRIASAEEMAQAVLFLASPAAAYMLGGELRLDGGMTQL
ncbi:SDR family oxidoreductase [Paludibacterium yongneupense]|uniref:SDR family oxidoreductase n=1 Tax=Paludibacterium yongneupense TaxID=400061 RepID=UPI000417A3AB|nr:SDR family oxidoreductase [Paludibacterium yongneupense]